MDAYQSDTTREFLERSAYSQAANIATLGAGILVATVFSGGSVLVVLGLTLVANAIIQFTVEHYGVDEVVGDFLTGK